MSESSVDGIKIDFINELKDYIPSLREKVVCLKESSGDPGKDLAELHRLVHTIRGAASLVRLNNLSEVALQFEEVIEGIINHDLTLNTAILSAMVDTIDFFDTYSREFPSNDASDKNLRTRVLKALQDIHNFAVDVDRPDLLSQLLSAADPGEDALHVLNSGAIARETTQEIAAEITPAEITPAEITIDDFDLDADNLVAEDDLMVAEGECPENVAVEAEAAGKEKNTDVGKKEEKDDRSVDIDLPEQELLEEFYQEAEGHFQDLSETLSKLETLIVTPATLTSEHKELLRRIRRSVHTIKGAAAVIKLKVVAGWGHELEDVLDWLYEEADTLTPEVVEVITEAADMLERFVAAPREIDLMQVDFLRSEFKRIQPTVPDSGDIFVKETATDSIESVANDEKTKPAVEEKDQRTAPAAASSGGSQIKTLRVDMANVSSLVNLAGELTIALSGFDQDMEGLGRLIGEIDGARVRLSGTARDLELGYEVKAIQQRVSSRSILNVPAMADSEQTVDGSDFDSLELDRYSELNLIIRSLSETAVDVSTISRQLSDVYQGFDAYLNRLRILLSELNLKTIRMRMTPMSTISNRMRRTVRETAFQLDKKVRLVIHGEHIELDRMVWEKLGDPLMHLLRNAVDHGIEPITERQAAGKPKTAMVHITAAYQGNQVTIRVTDDGAGINYNAVRKAVALDRPEKDVDAMSEAELSEMVFLPGFSTRRTVSEVSGRGIGLDVVKENIRDLKGSVCVEKSVKGSGTTFRITIPLTMAVMQALLFDAGGRRYATALYDIKELLRVDPRKIKGQRQKSITIEDRCLPFYDLAQNLTGESTEAGKNDSIKRPLVLIVESESWQGAVAIDRMHGQREIVIKNLGNHLPQIKGIAGATVMGDGKVIPILNLEELLRDETSHDNRNTFLNLEEIQKKLEIMVVDDSVSVRTVVSRLMQRQGWQVRTARDGVEAIELLHIRQPDLIVLDVEMPRMNGYEFMSSIRAQEKFKDTPVIMLTSRTAGKHRKKAEALGVNGFVTKPYVDEEFIDLVKHVAMYP